MLIDTGFRYFIWQRIDRLIDTGFKCFVRQRIPVTKIKPRLSSD